MHHWQAVLDVILVSVFQLIQQSFDDFFNYFQVSSRVYGAFHQQKVAYVRIQDDLGQIERFVVGVFIHGYDIVD
jgi:hypothetical protein